MTNPGDISTEPTVELPRVSVSAETTAWTAAPAPAPIPRPVPAPDPRRVAEPVASPAPEPTPEPPRRGPAFVAGASVAALVIGAFGGYLYGSSGSESGRTDTAAVSGTDPGAAPVPGPGQFLSTVGTVDSVAGDSFVLVIGDGTRAPVRTTRTTSVITLRGSAPTDLWVGDSVVVAGVQMGREIAANLVIAGNLPGLVPTTAPDPGMAAEPDTAESDADESDAAEDSQSDDAGSQGAAESDADTTN
ncbi:hypothetical protein [Rhodococcus kronopolitis]|uniref:DUF5666 domain-containing protein n=1 Tax=Rhodococcus kronopolitis TaxID=1460226 RepID=A0ABV9FRG2_9NOCA